MTDSRFHEMAARICDRAGAVVMDIGRNLVRLEIDDVRFILMDGAMVEPGSMIFLCELGEIPRRWRLGILQRLLDAHLLTTGVATACFSVNDENGQVLLMSRVPPDRVSALAGALLEHAELAVRWRRNALWNREDMRVASPDLNRPHLRLVTGGATVVSSMNPGSP